MIPENLKYTDQHEWIRVDGNVGVIGITHHAQQLLGDITFVELPTVGRDLAQGAEACVIESAKAAASVYAPASGRVTDVNSALEDDPSLPNSDPYGEGWILKIELSSTDELATLMSAKEYEEFLKKEDA